MQSEPVAIINAVTRLVEMVVVMLVAFGMNWTPEQVASVVAVAAGVGVVVQTVLVRRRVTPTARAEEQLRRANMPPHVRS